MNCPVCGEPTGVLVSRRECDAVYRYRKCKDCGYLFYTTELESGSKDFYRLQLEAKRKSQRKRRSASL